MPLSAISTIYPPVEKINKKSKKKQKSADLAANGSTSLQSPAVEGYTTSLRRLVVRGRASAIGPGINGAGVGMSVGREHAAGQDNAFAANTAVSSHKAAQFVGAGGVQLALPGHADFAGIVPEVAEYATAAHVHVVFNDRIAHIGEVRDKNLVAQQGVFDLHRISDDAVIAHADVAAQVGIRADGAVAAYAHAPFDDGTGFHHGAFAQLQHAVHHSQGVHSTATVGLQLRQLSCILLQALPRG